MWGQLTRRTRSTFTWAVCANHPVSHPSSKGGDTKCSLSDTQRHNVVLRKTREVQVGWEMLEPGRAGQHPCGQPGWRREPGLGLRPALSSQQQNPPMENIFLGKDHGSRRCQTSPGGAAGMARCGMACGAACIACAVSGLASLPEPHKHLHWNHAGNLSSHGRTM